MSRRLRRRFQIDIRSSKGKRTRLRKDMIGSPTNFQHLSHAGSEGVLNEVDGQLINSFVLVDLDDKRRSLDNKKSNNEESVTSSEPPSTDDSQDGNGNHKLQGDMADLSKPKDSAHEVLELSLPSVGLEKSQRKRRSLRLKKKNKIRHEMIGSPYNFQHVSHAGFDGENNFFQFNLEKQVEEQIRTLIRDIGVTKSQMARPKTREFVYNILERHGVLEEARRESQILTQKRLSGQSLESDKVSVGRGHDGSRADAPSDSDNLSNSSLQGERSPKQSPKASVPKSRHRAGKRQAPRPPTEVREDVPGPPDEGSTDPPPPDVPASSVTVTDAPDTSFPVSDAQIIHCIVSEGMVVHTVKSYVINQVVPAPPQNKDSSVISIEVAPTPPPPRKSFKP